MAYSVSEDFRTKCYSGESLYSCRLIIGGQTIPTSQLASITISSPIIDDQKETFYIGTFISQKLTIKFKNLDGIDTTSGTNVELYISQYVNNSWEEVPIGKYIIDESPENYYQTAQIECLDYAIKFATNLDYSPCFVDGKTTIDDLLEWICAYYDVTLGDYPNTNGDVEIGTYDSTVSGKRWISYIAEIKGCNAKMDRLGQLTLVPLKSTPAVTIDALKSKSWELGEKFEISQVTFFDAIRNYTFGGELANVNYNDNPLYYNGRRIGYTEDVGNTLIIRQDNPFVVDEDVVQNIYDVVNGFEVWSLTTENYGDISLDAWDIIEYTLGEETYYALNNNTITYAMTIMSKVSSKIPTKQQEITTNVVEGTEEQRIRKLTTEVNTLDNKITIQAEEQSELSQEVAGLTITTDTIQANVTETTNNLSNQLSTLANSTSLQINAINTQLEDGVEKLTNSLVKIDVNGINTSRSDETFNTQMTNKTFEVKDGNNRLGFMGFDTARSKTLVEFPEMETQKFTYNYFTNEGIEEDNLLWSADYFTGGGN